MSSKTQVICIKQGNRPNDWWQCSERDAKNLESLIEKCKKSGKSEKHTYENSNGDKIILEGHPDKGITFINTTKEPNRVRFIIPIVAPIHEGFPKSKNKVSSRSSRVSSRIMSKRKSFKPSSIKRRAKK